MAVVPIPHRTLAELCARTPIASEDPGTGGLISRLARRDGPDGELSRREFLDICYWKSPRSIGHCRKNSSRLIRKISRAVFHSPDEMERMELLVTLRGVGVPTASAILTLTDPEHYGVIDIRVWQLLHALGAVAKNPRGEHFGIRHWLDYLHILRTQARRLNVSPRLVELTLFNYHRDRQAGRLYRRKL